MKQVEKKLQIQCITYFKYAYPMLEIIHIPNGGSRHILEAVNFKRMGVRSGVPDLFIPSHRIFIELKADKGQLSKAQKYMINYLKEHGYNVFVCRSFDEFKQILDEYLSKNN